MRRNGRKGWGSSIPTRTVQNNPVFLSITALHKLNATKTLVFLKAEHPKKMLQMKIQGLFMNWRRSRVDEGPVKRRLVTVRFPPFLRRVKVLLSNETSTTSSCTSTNVQTLLQFQDAAIRPSQLFREHRNNRWLSPVLWSFFSSFFLYKHINRFTHGKERSVVIDQQARAPRHLKNTACLGAIMATYEINHCHRGNNDRKFTHHVK